MSDEQQYDENDDPIEPIEEPIGDQEEPVEENPTIPDPDRP
jgi:hypothetical protein